MKNILCVFCFEFYKNTRIFRLFVPPTLCLKFILLIKVVLFHPFLSYYMYVPLFFNFLLIYAFNIFNFYSTDNVATNSLLKVYVNICLYYVTNIIIVVS